MSISRGGLLEGEDTVYKSIRCRMHIPSLHLYMQAQQWIRDFLDLSRLEGYQRKNVTPYMHCLVYHVPQQIRTHGNIIKFSGQGSVMTHIHMAG